MWGGLIWALIGWLVGAGLYRIAGGSWVYRPEGNKPLENRKVDVLVQENRGTEQENRKGAGRETSPSTPLYQRVPALLVEAVAVLAFVGIWVRFGWGWRSAVTGFYLAVLLLIAVIDLQHRRVPDVILGPTALVALAANTLLPGSPGLPSSLLGGIAGFGVLLIIALAYPGGMGAGDVKLAGVIGLMTGLSGVIVALATGILAGGLAAGVLLVTRRVGRKSYIAYAPYLCLGAAVALLYGDHIWRWYLSHLIG